ncbi:MAG: hypothetical protein ACRC1W_09150, partial [Shewanella sp.]
MQNKINRLRLGWGVTMALSAAISQAALAAKVSFSEFCPQFTGQWVGDAAKVGELPRKVTVSGFCSHDKRQLLL